MKPESIKQALHRQKRFKQKVMHKQSRSINPSKVPDVPKGLYKQCDNCKKTFAANRLEKTLQVCPHCDHHARLKAVERLRYLVDSDSFKEKGLGYISLDPLFIEGYEQKLEQAKTTSDIDEAFIYGYARIEGFPLIVGVFDSHFMMASMGSVVGEKIAKSVEYAIQKRLPLVLFIASGGARMQEGIFSLMQMAKTSAAIKKMHEEGLLYISVLTHPTTGGVSASVATLGDIILSEPGALIGFAGPRVIKQTIKQDLPEGFQRSEFLLQKGMVDKIVHRDALRPTLHKILALHETPGV